MRREVRFFDSVTRENNDATTILAIKDGKTVRRPSWGAGGEGQGEGRMVLVAAKNYSVAGDVRSIGASPCFGSFT